MPTFLLYSLKAAGCLAVFYLFYKLLLSRDTLHRMNRVLLCGVLLLFVFAAFVCNYRREGVARGIRRRDRRDSGKLFPAGHGIRKPNPRRYPGPDDNRGAGACSRTVRLGRFARNHLFCRDVCDVGMDRMQHRAGCANDAPRPAHTAWKRERFGVVGPDSSSVQLDEIRGDVRGGLCLRRRDDPRA